MTQNNQPPAPAQATSVPPSKVALTSALIAAQPSAKALFDLPQFAENWALTYSKVSGKGIEEARNRFEAEKVLFLQALSNNTQLADTDRFSQYVAFSELGISGGTLRDGLCYIVPLKGKAQFWPGWKFRLEQINELPNVVHCHEPVVVYDCDDFDFERGMKTIIKKHIPKPRSADNKITYVYFIIEFTHGPDVYIMDAIKCYQIRDQYSSSYKEYLKKKAANKWESWMELPMWIKDESQAVQKTIVKQTWKYLPKLPKHKWIDERLKAQGLIDKEPEDIKAEEGAAENLDNLLVKEEPKQPEATGAGTTQATQAGDGGYIAFEETKNNNTAAPAANNLQALADNPEEGF